MQKILIIIHAPPYGSERCLSALRVASEDLQILFDKAFIKLLVGRLMADFNRQEVAREAFEACISRSIDAGRSGA